eukprot:SAG11_NODE_16372_length_549_cov_1.220000_1_plen_21_part_10
MNERSDLVNDSLFPNVVAIHS